MNTELPSDSVERNRLRVRLWADDEYAHRWIYHFGRLCDGKCTASSERLGFYKSSLETGEV